MKPAHSRKALGGGGNPFGHVSQWGVSKGAFEWRGGMVSEPLRMRTSIQ